MQVTVHQHRLTGGSRQRVRGRDDVADLPVQTAGGVPGAAGSQPVQRLAGHRAAGARGAAAHRVVGEGAAEVVGDLPGRAGRGGTRRPGQPAHGGPSSGSRASASSTPGTRPSAPERPRVAVGGHSEELGHRDGQRQPGRQPGEHGELPVHQRHGDLATREPEHPGAVDQVDRVVEPDARAARTDSSASSGNCPASRARAADASRACSASQTFTGGTVPAYAGQRVRSIPPSTGTIAPVRYDAAGDRTNAATRPNSAGSP